MRIWRKLHDTLLAPGAEAVLVTVFEAAGSTPCEVGARMIVLSEDEAIGTIGGGMLEWESLHEARKALGGQRGQRCWKTSKLLGPDLAQCCGGAVTLLFEHFSHSDLAALSRLAAAEDHTGFTTLCTFDERGRVLREISALPATHGEHALEISGADAFSERFGRSGTPLILFGAGHVGKALIRALESLPFEVTWVDSRVDAFPEVLPANVRSLSPANPPEVLLRAPANSLVVVMTHSHALDLELTAAALARPSFPFVGLIGSGSKCARFRRRLRDFGITSQATDRLTCPIGIEGIRGKEPAVIAASVTAQLLTIAYAPTDDASTDDVLPTPSV